MQLWWWSSGRWKISGTIKSEVKIWRAGQKIIELRCRSPRSNWVSSSQKWRNRACPKTPPASMRSKDRQQSTGILFTRRAMNAQYDDCGCSSNGGGQPTWCSNRCDERQRDVSVCLVVKNQRTNTKNKYNWKISISTHFCTVTSTSTEVGLQHLYVAFYSAMW